MTCMSDGKIHFVYRSTYESQHNQGLFSFYHLEPKGVYVNHCIHLPAIVVEKVLVYFVKTPMIEKYRGGLM